ncbi:MAG: 4'-phosphopantetheinyl transferase superfamily protein [Parasporobacterium sp.]|nr:4'-phosphopantetheinyl transferase superfamily protein [Parasporobacterium sp.]
MIRSYLINRNELEKINYSEDILSTGRKEKIAKIKREDDKQLSACAELLLIYGLRKQLQEVSLPLSIEEDDRNKLILKDIPLYFNISHASEYAVCSISDRPIGVDIEYFRVRELIHPEKILHPEEVKLMGFVTNQNEKKKFFYECWVQKESYLKNLGIGLIVRPGEFRVHEDRLVIRDEDFSKLKGKHSGKISFSLGEAPKGKDNTLAENLSYLEQRYVHLFEPGEIRGTDWKFDAGYRMAVCSMEKDDDNTARLIHAEDINEVLA